MKDATMDSRHLSDERVVDVALGNAVAGERLHADVCESCRERVERVRSDVELAQQVDVPEPSPLYWEHFGRAVHRRITAETPGRGPLLRLRWMPTLLATASLVLAVSIGRSPGRPFVAMEAPTLPAWSALPPTDEDAGLAVLEGLAVTAGETEIVPVAFSEELAELSDGEREAFASLLNPVGEGSLL